MFKAGTSLQGKTEEEIVMTDIKTYQVEEKKIAISQVFTLNFEEIYDKKDTYISLIEEIQQEKEYHLVLLVVTDMIKNGSYVFYTRNNQERLEVAFAKEHLEQGYYLDGWVSRKKQFVPVVMDVIK